MIYKLIAFFTMFILSVTLNAQDNMDKIETTKEIISYCIGVDVARSFIQREFNIDYDILIKGFRDVYAGNKLLLSDDEIRKYADAYKKEIQQKQLIAMINASKINKQEGIAFLSKNKSKEGIITLKSGLQYEIIKEGNGRKPLDEEYVEVYYKGSHIDGTLISSISMKGKPGIYPLKSVIPGWKEALKLMPVGSKWRLFIPPELAYGTSGVGKVGPNETIIFELELLAIKNEDNYITPDLLEFDYKE